MNHRPVADLLGSAVALALVCLASSSALADYPIASHRYLADPGSLVYDGRVYLYASNDDDNDVGGGYAMHSFVCVSSSDLKNWTDHGIVLQVPPDATWAQYSWAPSALERDGTFYLYFGNNASSVGVASSDSPTSEFKDAKGSALVDSSTPGASGTDIWLFDPGAFIDDDGQGYLAFGGNGANNGRIIKLGSDLVSVSGSAVSVSTTNFFEAAFLFKRNNIYYFAYSTDSASGQRIDYQMSSSPMSGYTYGGVIGGQPPNNNNNNHASEFEYNGQWYHAYHNRYVATQAGISTTYRRNLALEVLNFDGDGKIQEVTYTTDGVPQVGHLDPYTRVEAETTNAQSGIETGKCSEGGMDVTEIDNGDWIRLRGVDFGTAGANSFTASVASSSGGGSIELRLDSDTGTLIGTCDVPNTGGDQSWQTVTCDVSGATGVKDLYLKFTGGGFNFDYWQFTGGDGGSGGTGGAAGQGGAAQAGGDAGTSAGGVAGSSQGGADSRGGRPGSGGALSNGGTANNGGSMSSGGALSNGGSMSNGGSLPGTGGIVSAGGALNSGGLAAIGGGANIPAGGASAGTSSTEASSKSDSGCGCRVVGRQTNSTHAVFGAFALLALGSFRRRSRGRSGPS